MKRRDWFLGIGMVCGIAVGGALLYLLMMVIVSVFVPR